MTKIKYYYNEESCSYEPVKTPLKIKLIRITSYLTLAGIIALFPVMVIFLVAQRLIVRGGATVGSVKG